MKTALLGLAFVLVAGLSYASILPATPPEGEWTSHQSADYYGLFYYSARIPQDDGSWISIPATNPETGAALWGSAILEDGLRYMISYDVSTPVLDGNGVIIPGATHPMPEPLAGHSIVRAMGVR